jgi:hypothetical protein
MVEPLSTDELNSMGIDLEKDYEVISPDTLQSSSGGPFGLEAPFSLYTGSGLDHPMPPGSAPAAFSTYASRSSRIRLWGSPIRSFQ